MRNLLSDTVSERELPNDYIIPSEYYDRYRLVFSHFHIDRKIGRIGLNGRQRLTKARRTADTRQGDGVSDDTRYSFRGVRVSREADNLQQFLTASSEIPRSNNTLN